MQKDKFSLSFFFIVLSNAFFISVLNLNTGFYFFVEEFFIAFFFAFALFFFIFYSLQIVLPRFSKKIESFLFFVNLFFCLVNIF